jgi:hypothetical protein
MDDLQSKLVEALQRAAERLRKADLPAVSAQMQQLATEVDASCVVAVVGRVKAGKSTFVNALLEDDLAKMGASETTATINYFCYGTPDPAFPVRCYWRTGKVNVTDESRAFLDKLQGNNEETLRNAANIDHLEYRAPRPFLQRVTLVDTPGTVSAVGVHEERVNQFMNVRNSLYADLKNYHHDETQRLGSAADAVIYLIGITAKSTDEMFLRQFVEATGDGSKSYNTIGVMAQIDIDNRVIERREELAQKAALQLEHRLNTVIPVSAAIERALQSLLAQDEARLKELMTVFRPVPPLPPDFLDALLNSSEAYDDFETFFPDIPCPVTPEQRKQVRGKRGQPGTGEPDEMPWAAFATIVRTVTDPSLADAAAIVEKLREISGFARLHTVLEQHFFRRGSLLRGYNIVNKALKLLDDIKDTYLREFDRRQEEDKARRERFLAFLQRVARDAVARELEEFVKERLFSNPSMDLMLQDIERDITRLKYKLEDYNEDFNALKLIEEYPKLFTKDEVNELQPLFGQHNLETDRRLQSSEVTLPYIENRQSHWESKLPPRGRDPIVSAVAQQALRLYGQIAESLVQES